MSDHELLPCPFCGGKTEVREYHAPSVERFFWCACTVCGAQSPPNGDDGTIAEAIAAWNRRVPPAPPTPDWSQAPAWANYYAIDGDGDAYWFEYEPQAETDIWCVPSGRGRWDFMERIKILLAFDWQQTLQRRPEAAP